MRRALVIASLFAGLLLAPVAEARGCRPSKGADVLAKSGQALFWTTTRTDADDNQYLTYRGCLRSARRPLRLASAYSDFRGHEDLLGAFALKGRFLAYRSSTTDSYGPEPYVGVGAFDLRTGARVVSERVSDYQTPGEIREMVLSTRGEVGLIVDRAGALELSVRAKDIPTVVLDRGAPGELSGLQVYGGVAYWRHGAEPRSAPVR